jgi:hypothetical protein
MNRLPSPDIATTTDQKSPERLYELSELRYGHERNYWQLIRHSTHIAATIGRRIFDSPTSQDPVDLFKLPPHRGGFSAARLIVAL